MKRENILFIVGDAWTEHPMRQHTSRLTTTPQRRHYYWRSFTDSTRSSPHQPCRTTDRTAACPPPTIPPPTNVNTPADLAHFVPHHRTSASGTLTPAGHSSNYRTRNSAPPHPATPPPMAKLLYQRRAAHTHIPPHPSIFSLSRTPPPETPHPPRFILPEEL